MKEFKYKNEIEHHLVYDIAPFWKKLRDDEYGGYYGLVDYELNPDEKAVKGCILNSRITWFFANAYDVTGDDGLLSEARHGYEFLRDHFVDGENGGVYWSLKYDGTPEDTTKHTYNQAFAIYALSSYYAVSRDADALNLAYELYDVIEDRCRDEGGYLEAFKVDFSPESNEKLSENGVEAARTMNTALHVLEAYTELYLAGDRAEVKASLEELLDIFLDRIYISERSRLGVFFDLHYGSLIDLYSYGHDIEAAWLIDRALAAVKDYGREKEVRTMTRALTASVYAHAYRESGDVASLPAECERGIDKETRVWWVQAEAVVGYLNRWQLAGDQADLDRSFASWDYIKRAVIAPDGEWYWGRKASGAVNLEDDRAGFWKCPYHNGRMCMELITRLQLLP